MQQYTRTVLPQGVGDSTHLFTQAPRKGTKEINLKEVLFYSTQKTLISSLMGSSNQNTISMISLGPGVTVSQIEAHISKQQVKYGIYFKPHNRQLSPRENKLY